MVSLKQKDNRLLISMNEDVVIYNGISKTYQTLKIPEPVSQIYQNKQQALKKGNNKITSICFSKSAEYIGISTQSKQLLILNYSSEIIKHIILNKCASKIRFSPQNNIVVADKTGDVFLYKLSADKDEPHVLLGHLSMLLDVVISDCGKYIITCDRDEKIRVSQFPNAYNIVSFCLGHTEFVTNIELFGKVLISASGDGTIRMWDYINGEQLHMTNTNDYLVDKNIIQSFCEQMDTDKIEVHALPITDMQTFKSSSSTFVAVSILHFDGVQLYKINTKSTNFQLLFLQNITISKLIAFTLEVNLYILTANGFELYSIKDENYVGQAPDEYLNAMYEHFKNVFQFNLDDHVIPTLYKRKFDNVQEYLDRKRLRLLK